MALGTPVYPTTLDTAATLGPTSGIVAGTTALNAVGSNQGNQLGITNNLINTVVALETAVGVTGSTVTTSHEYRIRRAFWKVWVAGLEGCPPATLYAVFGVRNSIPFLAFDTATSWSTVFIGVVPWGQVLTSGVVVRIKWMAATATTLKTVWGCSFERMNTDEDADSFDTETVDAGVTCSGTSGIMVESAITCTNIDSMVAGDAFRLKVARKVADANDTMAGDAQMVTVSIENAI